MRMVLSNFPPLLEVTGRGMSLSGTPFSPASVGCGSLLLEGSGLGEMAEAA